MTILPMGDILTIAAHEYGKPCDECGDPAEWAAWAVHVGVTHSSHSGFLCDVHKAFIEAGWIADIVSMDACACGHPITGQLSDNFRAIRL